MFKKI